MLTFLLLLCAFIAFLLLMFGAAVPRINLLGLGLALWVLAELIGTWP